jgi:rare lipoprotein A
MQRVLTNILVAFTLVTSLAAAPEKSSNPSTKVVRAKRPVERQASSARPFQVGRASWYGKFFHGKPTASGEPYDMFLFTAAHRVLPLGTLVKVTNLSNGASVVVRVNDRGPVPLSRVIDLSYGAAQMLRFRQEGVEKVRLDLVEPPAVAAIRNASLTIP